jgi:hypothetical protein
LLASLLATAPVAALSGPTILDINGDGRGEILTAGYLETLPGAPGAGALSILFGGPQGPGSGGQLTLEQGKAPVGGVSEANDHFGYASAAGDFDGDGDIDLAVSAPWKTVRGQARAGQVYVLPNQGGQLGTAVVWNQDSPGLEGEPEYSDRFGESLVAGDFNRDGISDLAIGIPGDSFFFGPGGSFRNAAGAVQVLYGSPTGFFLGLPPNSYFRQEPEPLATSGYGSSLAWSEGGLRLAVGAPNSPVGAVKGAGTVSLLRAEAGIGLSTNGVRTLHQDTPGVRDKAEKDDFFGSVILDGCDGPFGIEILIVAATLEDVGTLLSGKDAGIVHVLVLSPNGEVLSDRIVKLPKQTPSAFFGSSLASLCDEQFMLLFAGAPLGEANGKRSGVVYNFVAMNDGPFQLKQTLSLDTPGVPGSGANGSFFGASASAYRYRAGDYHVAVGAPGQSVSGAQAAGELFDFRIGSDRLFDVGTVRRLRQKGAGGPEAGDQFGAVVRASGD